LERGNHGVDQPRILVGQHGSRVEQHALLFDPADYRWLVLPQTTEQVIGPPGTWSDRQRRRWQTLAG
jgi:hypothetical protein